MSAPITPAMVRDALAKTRSKTLLNAPGWDASISKWADGLNEFIADYQARFKNRPDPIGILDSAPAKGVAFWELDTLRLSTEMKIAVWRILLGCEILAIHLRSDKDSFELKLVLGTVAFQDEVYSSQHSEDLRIVRHLGTIEFSNRTHFQGYYAFA